jgi:hypothetical protein
LEKKSVKKLVLSAKTFEMWYKGNIPTMYHVYLQLLVISIFLFIFVVFGIESYYRDSDEDI